jgi:O-antigen/teichoic acid export membrane protein
MARRWAPGFRGSALFADAARLAPTFLVPGIASFVSAPILFAILGAGAYGVLALAMAIALGIPYLTTSWVEATIIRFGHVRAASRLPEILSLVASGLAGTLVAAFVLRDESPILWVETGVLTAAMAAYVLQAAHLQSMMRFSAVSWLATYRAVFGSALAVLLGFVSGSPQGAVIGFAIGFAVVTVLSADRRRPSESASPMTGTVASGPRRFGVASMGVAIGLYVLTAGDRFVLDVFRPLSEVGVYAISYTLTEMVIRLIPSVLLVVVRPRVFRLWDIAQTDRAHTLIGDAIALLLWAMACVQIVWLVLVRFAMTSVDPHIAGPVSIGITSLSIAFALSLILTARLAQTRLALTTITCAILAIVANIAITPRLGGVGAALVTALVYSILMLVHWAGTGLRLGSRNGLVAGVAFLSVAVNGLAVLSDSPLGFVWGAVSLVVVAPVAIRIARSLAPDSSRPSHTPDEV